MGYDKKNTKRKSYKSEHVHLKKNLKIEQLNFKEEQIRKKLAE